MLFSSGIGISLLYFGASEPLDHYFNPPEGGGQPRGRAPGLQLTFLHWGLHGWAIYALVGLAVGTSPTATTSRWRCVRRCTRWSASVGSRALPARRGHLRHVRDPAGPGDQPGDRLDAGVLGPGNLFGMDHSKTNLLVILVMAGVATIAAVSGVENGIRRLSNLNIVLFSGLLIFVLLAGPTLHLLNGFVQNIGDYLNGIVLKTFDLYVYEGEAASPSAGWACGPCSTGPGGSPGAVRRHVHRAYFQGPYRAPAGPACC
jgi:choline/glycine/proline betaine transport protein